MTPNQLPPLPEPDTHCFDDDTGKDVWSYTADQMHAYALAALAQQAQEPVAWLYVDTVGERYLCFSRPTGGGAITDLYATPPSPQPAPVDERSDFEASMREKHGWVARDFQSDSFGYFDGHTATAWLAWQARAALQSPAPQAGGWLPIESAPNMGVVLLLVEHEEDRRVMVAEASSEDGGGWYWMKTHGWTGWSRLHGSWAPIGWQPLPPAPQTKG